MDEFNEKCHPHYNPTHKVILEEMQNITRILSAHIQEEKEARKVISEKEAANTKAREAIMTIANFVKFIGFGTISLWLGTMIK